jgi:capsular polysaccharide biosynthesis protein
VELRQLWKIALRRWWLIALPAIAALAYAVYGYVSTPMSGGYATSIRFTAAEPPTGTVLGYEDRNYYPWLASEYVVNALTDWVKTSSFADELSLELANQGEEIAPGVLQSAVSADNARSVMVLFLNWPDSKQLESIAAAAVVVLRERSDDYFPQFGQGGVTVIALDDPVITAVPQSLTNRFDPLIRFGLGLFAGIALAFLVDYLDPTLHERQDVESAGLTVLAEIPRQGMRR